MLADVSISLIPAVSTETYDCEDFVSDDCCHSDREADRNHVVLLPSLVEVRSKSPSSRVGVVRLHGCTTPRGVTVTCGQQLFVRSDDGYHNNVADEATEDSTPALCQEHDARGNLDYTVRQWVSWCAQSCLYLRYSPIFKSLDKSTALLMTLCDQAAKYMFPTGRSGTIKPASILDKLFVAIPLPYLE
jgi:hypothetical protein